MSPLGHFLEVSLRTPDILESLDFYRSLGFTELQTGDIYPHKYAVVSDGALCLGLHETEFTAPAITYVCQGLAGRVRRMLDGGFDFQFMHLDDDEFHRLGLHEPSGHTVTMVEARTFQAPDPEQNDSACGAWYELSLPVRDAISAARFWASVAPRLMRLREEPTAHLRFDAGDVPVGLSESIALAGPSLCFKCCDRPALDAAIERRGLSCTFTPGYEGARLGLATPEGLTLYIFDEDFLGESYEISESDDLSGFPA
jgi:catechol 2,3-dioxygenase-like lactoylglutathione lyase family enzyme